MKLNEQFDKKPKPANNSDTLVGMILQSYDDQI